MAQVSQRLIKRIYMDMKIHKDHPKTCLCIRLCNTTALRDRGGTGRFSNGDTVSERGGGELKREGGGYITCSNKGEKKKMRERGGGGGGGGRKRST